MGIIHWWLPGTVAACEATIKDDFTGVPILVNCPECKSYVDIRMGVANANH